MNRMSRMVMLGILVAVPALAGVIPVSVRWVWHEPSVTAREQMSRPAWLHIDPERVSVDLSIDGATWTELARGVPSRHGTNVWTHYLPDDPAYLSDAALIRVRTLRTHADPTGAHVVSNPIRGLYITDIPATVTNGTEVVVRWVCAGAGDWVQLGVDDLHGNEPGFRADVLAASVDSIGGAVTNQLLWYVADLQPGPASVVIQSMSDSRVHRVATVEVVNE